MQPTTVMPTTFSTPAAEGAPAAYDGLDCMLLNGRWTHGLSGQSVEDVDPYTNEVLLRIPLAKVRGDDEPLPVANETSDGMSSAVFTREVERGDRFAQRVQAGITHVNDSPVN